jgi:hypothetical protein
VPGALPRRTIHPLRLEPEPVELSPQDAADLANALEVARAAVDVDNPLDERKSLAIVGVDVGGDSEGAIGLAALNRANRKRERQNDRRGDERENNATLRFQVP